MEKGVAKPAAPAVLGWLGAPKAMGFDPVFFPKEKDPPPAALLAEGEAPKSEEGPKPFWDAPEAPNLAPPKPPPPPPLPLPPNPKPLVGVDWAGEALDPPPKVKEEDGALCCCCCCCCCCGWRCHWLDFDPNCGLDWKPPGPPAFARKPDLPPLEGGEPKALGGEDDPNPNCAEGGEEEGEPNPKPPPEVELEKAFFFPPRPPRPEDPLAWVFPKVLPPPLPPRPCPCELPKPPEPKPKPLGCCWLDPEPKPPNPCCCWPPPPAPKPKPPPLWNAMGLARPTSKQRASRSQLLHSFHRSLLGLAIPTRSTSALFIAADSGRAPGRAKLESLREGGERRETWCGWSARAERFQSRGKMRIMIKGGVWKNSEDEILKAAVMKYGQQQWARVSSLLTRKSAKQCKARWFEWLDPSIKKTDWTRQEDEKLLHLAKLMPTQWRTIAPIVGRTSAQCLERYEQLLDQAANGTLGEGSSTASARRLRAGEIDTQPETRPARPDPVDMDEDEKEMLNEARARLANTKGKKAKRKAREKQLEEARRLASLQKRRELKAAGIGGKNFNKKLLKKGEIDYNAEIPFEHKPPPGFYDTSDERNRNKDEMKRNKDFNPVSLESLEGRRRKDVEADMIRNDRARQKMLERKNMPQVVAQQMQDSQGPAVRRGRMVLPAPQLSDSELSQISRMNAQDEVDAGVADGAGGRATKMLLADYSATPNPMATPMRTPRAVTTSGTDVLLQEAEQLAKMERLQSTLMGGEGTSIDASTFSGAMPDSKVVSTPNPLATPLHSGHPIMSKLPPPRSGAATPMTMATPLRDGLQINRQDQLMEIDTELEARRALDLQRQNVKLGLSALPQPKNEYQVVVPDLPATMEVDDDDDEIEDMADVIAKRREREEEERRAELRMRSQVIQRDLPRPRVQPKSNLCQDLLSVASDATASASEDGSLPKAEELVVRELELLIGHDNAKFPVKKGQGAGKVPAMEIFEEAEIFAATAMIREEAGKMMKAAGGGTLEGFARRYAEVLESLERKEEEDTNASVPYLKACFSNLKKEMNTQSKAASKLEKKIGILNGGLQAKQKDLLQRLREAQKKHEAVAHQLASYRLLEEREKVAAPQRLAKINKEIQKEKEKEAVLQKEYAQAYYAKGS